MTPETWTSQCDPADFATDRRHLTSHRGCANSLDYLGIRIRLDTGYWRLENPGYGRLTLVILSFPLVLDPSSITSGDPTHPCLHPSLHEITIQVESQHARDPSTGMEGDCQWLESWQLPEVKAAVQGGEKAHVRP